MAEKLDDEKLCIIHPTHERCDKYKADSQHHHKFKPKTEFVSALPTNFKNEQVIQFINSIFALSVRLFVQWKSADREGDYVNVRNKRFGTGHILNVTEIDSKQSKLSILTAKHVVYDDSEAEKTDVWLNYNQPVDKAVKCQGIRVVKSDPEKDICILECIIDTPNIEDINRNITEKKKTRARLLKKYKNSQRCMLVSHPHGCIGYFSIGELLPVTDSLQGTTYDTPTCGGSSGGCIIIFKNFELLHNGTEYLKFNYSKGPIETDWLHSDLRNPN